ncbi:hypothetical protein ABZT49_30615 [Methylobacterium sp. EM32]|uniref:hypothetical protein n=1 Tax=Methylobacterium sp. EM32 TaxID=3163481 RepID=UPI0033A7EF3F
MAIGPSTTQTPYLVPSTGNVSLTSILSVGDTVPGSVKANGTPWRFVGIPDGIGALDNGDGTATVLVNHEIGATSGVVRAHGAAGAFVDRLIVDKASLKVLSASDLGTGYYGFNTAIGTCQPGTTALARLCSADLPAVSAFYDAGTGLGTRTRIFMNGEETGAEGRALAWIVDGPEAGRIYELPRLGKFSMENSLANPASGAKTVTIGTDDSSTGQLYVYVGTKQATGSEIEGGPHQRQALRHQGPVGPRRDQRDLARRRRRRVQPAGDGSERRLLAGDRRPAPGRERCRGRHHLPAARGRLLGSEQPEPLLLRHHQRHHQPVAAVGARLHRRYPARTRRHHHGAAARAGGQVMLDNLTVTADGKVILQEDPGNNACLSKVFTTLPQAWPRTIRLPAKS